MTIFARAAALVALALVSSVAQASDIGRTALIPPFEVYTIIRSMGFDPAGTPTLRGAVYIVRAFDDDDIPVRVTVDARSGRVITVTELTRADEYSAPARVGAYPRPPGRVPSVTYRSAPTHGTPASPPAVAAPSVRQSAVTPRTPTPRARPPQAKAPETTASIPDTKPGTGKSIPAPVAPSAAPPSSSGSAPGADEPAKTDTPLVPVAPLE
jgi:hypothetical protein